MAEEVYLDDEQQEFYDSDSLKHFICEEFSLIRTIMGARKVLPHQLWGLLKANSGIDPKSIPLYLNSIDPDAECSEYTIEAVKTVGAFLGFYCLMEDLSGIPLGSLESSWDNDEPKPMRDLDRAEDLGMVKQGGT